MKEISLTQGKVALVDDEDFERVSQFKWHTHHKKTGWYAKRGIYNPDKQNSDSQGLHTFILPGVGSIDHKDGNGLNNQKFNLRPATKKQNAQAVRKKAIGKTSQYRGVFWLKNNKCWQAKIEHNRKQHNLGLHEDEKDAALAYNNAAIEHFGEFAALNKI